MCLPLTPIYKCDLGSHSISLGLSFIIWRVGIIALASLSQSYLDKQIYSTEEVLSATSHSSSLASSQSKTTRALWPNPDPLREAEWWLFKVETFKGGPCSSSTGGSRTQMPTVLTLSAQLKHNSVMTKTEWALPRTPCSQSDMNMVEKLLWDFFFSSRENCWKKRGLCIIPTKFGISFTVPFLNQVIALYNFVHLHCPGVPFPSVCTVARLPKWHSGNNDLPANAGDTSDADLIPGLGKIPCSRKWQPTQVFLSGRFHGQRSLAGYSPWGCKESDMTEHACMHLYIMSFAHFFCQVTSLYFLNFKSTLCIMDIIRLSVIWMQIFSPIYLLSLVNDFFAMHKKLLNIFM